MATRASDIQQRSRLVQAALSLGGFSAEELMRRADVGQQVLTRTLTEWLGSGFILVAAEDADGSGTSRYRVAALASPGRAAPELNLWRAMRGLGTFSALDVRVHANTPEVEISDRAVRDYIRVLVQAAYLRVLQKAGPGREAVYRLVRNSGPGAPAVRRVQTLIDPNLGGAVWAAVPAVAMHDPVPLPLEAQRIRVQRGELTQEEFAARVGITRQMLANYESGRTVPGPDVLERIARVAGAEGRP